MSEDYQSPPTDTTITEEELIQESPRIAPALQSATATKDTIPVYEVEIEEWQAQHQRIIASLENVYTQITDTTLTDHTICEDALYGVLQTFKDQDQRLTNILTSARKTQLSF